MQQKVLEALLSGLVVLLNSTKSHVFWNSCEVIHVVSEIIVKIHVIELIEEVNMDSLNMEYMIVEGKTYGSTLLYLINQKYLFKMHDNAKDGKTVYLRCYSKRCSARLKIINIVNGTGDISYSNSHHSSHECHETLCKEYQLMGAIKTQIVSSSLPIKEIFEEECSKPEFQGVAQSLEYAKLRNGFSKLRNKTIPKIPQSAELVDVEFQKPEVKKLFGMSKHFPTPNVFYKGSVGTSAQSQNGISTIFYSEIIGSQLENTNRKLHIDGTFFVVPKIYNQLLIIHIEVKNHVSTFFYFLIYIVFLRLVVMTIKVNKN